MNKIKVLALFGETGCGKSTLQKWITTNMNNTHKVISYTSRPKRNYEKDGKDYFFVSEKSFIDKMTQGMMIEWNYFNHWFYGTSIDNLEVDQINIGIFNIEGIQKLLKQSEEIDCTPLLITAPDKIRLQRSLVRESNPDCNEICRRFLSDKKDFSKIPFEYLEYVNIDSKQKFLSNYLPVLNKIMDNDN